MNPIGKMTRAITHPVRTAGSVAGQALGLAAAGARTTASVMEWTASHVPGSDEATDPTPARPQETAVATPRPVAVPTDAPEAEATEAVAPARPASARAGATGGPKSAKKKAPRKAPVKKAPSAKAATAGPALAAAAKEAGEDPSLVTRAVTSADDSASAQDDGDASEPLLDLSVAKAIRHESEVLRKAADPHKG